MTDQTISDQLRSIERSMTYKGWEEDRKSVLRAADEIEALRAERDHFAERAGECVSALDRTNAERYRLRARIAEVTCPECGIALGMTDHHMDCETGRKADQLLSAEAMWRMENKAAIQALVDGRAAVVPLNIESNHDEFRKTVEWCRLDKPMETTK